MTIYGPNGGVVVGQPISPNFGAQNGASPAGGAAIALPAGMSMLEAMSRGILPRNAYVTSVNGASTGAGDNVSVDELMATGNGNQSMRGTPVPPSGGINDQQFTAGTSAVALQVNGPTQTNTEPQPLAPVSGAILCGNIAQSGFGG
jgi:hypothetical protein